MYTDHQSHSSLCHGSGLAPLEGYSRILTHIQLFVVHCTLGYMNVTCKYVFELQALISHVTVDINLPDCLLNTLKDRVERRFF